MHCTLCGSSQISIYFQDKAIQYFECKSCDLVFQDPKTYLSAVSEKEIYDSHQNNPEDERYRNFLARIVNPLKSMIQPGQRGLDYGCGPGPTISVMLAADGVEVDNYDLYYTPEFVPQVNSYDFITSTEAFEHFYRPGQEVDRIWSLLRPGGLLGIMTLLRPDTVEEFDKWWYKKDPTHVCFFNRNSFEFLAKKLSGELEILSDQVVFLRKK